MMKKFMFCLLVGTSMTSYAFAMNAYDDESVNNNSLSSRSQQAINLNRAIREEQDIAFIKSSLDDYAKEKEELKADAQVGDLLYLKMILPILRAS